MTAARRGDPGPARAVRFINNLTHTKGEHAGRPFNLRPWQERIVRRLFRTRRDGTRDIRQCLIEIPRKNGKTEMAAALILYGLLGDGELGAEVYSAATDKEQAGRCYDVAAQMVRNDAVLFAQCELVDSQKRIVHRPSGSFYKALSSDAFSKHGLNASLVVYDELHAAPNRELYDVLATSMGARRNPLMVITTTAGYDRHSILWELHEHAIRCLENPALDPSFLPIIYAAPADANWQREKVWRACNPALGDYRSIDEIRILAARAAQIPAQENTFRRLYLNQWTEQASRWLPMAAWDACRQPVDRAALRGRRCFVGLDLSATTDLTAAAAVFPDADGFDAILQAWIPGGNLADRIRRDRVPYDLWAKDRYLELTSGDTVDYEAVRRQLRAWDDEFDVVAIGFDPWNATDLVERLKTQDGFTCIPVRQGFAAMSAPSKSLERAVVGRTLRQDGHPVLRWNVSNVSVESDASGNLKPSKTASPARIDGVVALIIAIDMMDRHAAPRPASTFHVYRDPPP